MTTDNEQMRAALLALLKEAFGDGFASKSTYNDKAENDAHEEWEKAKAGYASRIGALSAPARRVEAVALTGKQRNLLARRIVGIDPIALVTAERILMEAERAVWAANNLAAPKE